MLDHAGLQVTTYYGVPDGASIRFLRTPTKIGFHPDKTFNVSVSGTHAGLARVDYQSSCYAFSWPWNAPGNGTAIASGCPGDATFEMMAIAVGTTSPPHDAGAIIGAEVKTVNYSGSATIPAFAFATAPTIGTVKASAVKPGNVTSSAFTIDAWRAGNLRYSRGISDADSAGFVVEIPVNLFDAYTFHPSMSVLVSGTTYALLRHVEHATTLTGQTIAFGSTSFSLPAVPAAPDFAAAQLHFAFSGTMLGDAVVVTCSQAFGDQSVVHTVMQPPAQSGTVQLPTLPAGFEELAFVSAHLSQTVENVDVAGVADYGALVSAGWLFENGTFNESQLLKAYDP